VKRRDFLKISGGALAALGTTGFQATAFPLLPRRPLGKTGHERSVVTLGGVVVTNETQKDADRIVAEALDAGVNGIDVAPTYGDAELKLGHALQGKRDRVFLACKTTERDQAGAAAELRASLQRLRTDHVDLYQLHGLDKPEDLTQVLGPGGALEAFEEGRQQGLLRFIGLTGHRPDTLLSAIRQFDFASVVFPYSFILAHHGFGQELLAEANQRGIGVMAIKPIAQRRWQAKEPRSCPRCWYKPFEDDDDIRLAVWWALEQPIASLIPSGDMRLFRRTLKAAQHYKPLTDAQKQAREARAATLKPLFPG
jgi:aryl-alcohol dehydrogenase-like predicted oxidoreductase